jgi:hypothetical protein
MLDVGVGDCVWGGGLVLLLGRMCTRTSRGPCALETKAEHFLAILEPPWTGWISNLCISHGSLWRLRMMYSIVFVVGFMLGMAVAMLVDYGSRRL